MIAAIRTEEKNTVVEVILQPTSQIIPLRVIVLVIVTMRQLTEDMVIWIVEVKDLIEVITIVRDVPVPKALVMIGPALNLRNEQVVGVK